MNKKILLNPDDYGSKGNLWHPDFVAYMAKIVQHPNYKNMPDAIKEDGKIQWEAPSNRKSGLYKETHNKRRAWWEKKAKELGIDITQDKWISKTAKKNHPTGSKPCKKCGKEMELAYVYPNRNFIKRLNKVYGDLLEVYPLEKVTDLVGRIEQVLGEDGVKKLSTVFKRKEEYTAPEWITWLKEEYIPTEPSFLSPGAMSNAPDRLDGFHSFNLCCRKKADKGRNDSNMRGYTTDRRAFYFWADGNWIAADKMMGEIRKNYRNAPCADGGDGPPSADHIGPLSLGFKHTPQFRLLSSAANSAKNNRMTLQDVEWLRTQNAPASWYAQDLWASLNSKVTSDITALRLSKIMRDNQRVAMYCLTKCYQHKCYMFLCQYLQLDVADFDYSFEDISINNECVIGCKSLLRKSRKTKYVQEQKARRIRIAFKALEEYSAKKNRHSFPVDIEDIDTQLDKIITNYFEQAVQFQQLDLELEAALTKVSDDQIENSLRQICESNSLQDDSLITLMRNFEDIFGSVAQRFVLLWCDDRYVRDDYRFE